MDIYQIWMTHNRAWSVREVVCFCVIAGACGVILMWAVRLHKIKKSQGIAILALLFYLGIVFGSTVFTRMSTVREYELIPFWSWYAVFMKHDKTLLQENLLNCILFVPAGALLSMIRHGKVQIGKAFLFGFFVSALIECCQLIFMRGLFEWDDMVHNGLGCMLGCFMVNLFIKYWGIRNTWKV